MPDAIPTTLFQWTPDYAVGIEEIDREHRRLFKLTGRVHQAMLAGKGRQILESLLISLVNYTSYHFAHEEQVMERTGYPDLRMHRIQHEDLRSRVAAMQDRWASGEVMMTPEVTQFLMEWLKIHTTTSDRRIGEFLDGAHTGAPGAGS